jgi:hypothetical protein
MRGPLLALLGLVLLTPPLASATSATGTYDVATTPLVSLLCSPRCAGLPVNIGGYHFPAQAGEVPVHASVADASGTASPLLVCQDTNGNGICGEQGEPNVAACGQAALVGFSDAVDTLVFVESADPGCLGSVGTTGTITLDSTP